MAADIISTIGDLVKWIIDTVNKFKKSFLNESIVTFVTLFSSYN